MRHSLRTKLISTSIIIEVVMLTILLGNSFRLSNNLIEEQTELRIQSINPLLNASLSGALFQRDYEEINNIIEHLKGDEIESFEYIIVLDSHNKIYAQTDEFSIDKLPTLDENFNNAMNQGIFNGAYPLDISGQKVGEVRYGLSIASFVAGKEKILQQGFLIANIGVILTALLLALSIYYYTRNLGVLIKSTESIRQGNYDINIRIKTKDEIGLLANKFNLMAQAIHSRIDALNNSKHDLALILNDLSKEKELAQVTLESIADAVITTDAKGLIEYMNPNAEMLLGWNRHESSGLLIDDIFKIYNEITGAPLENPVTQCLQTQKTIATISNTLLISQQGKQYLIEESAAPMIDEQENIIGVVLTFRDVSSSRKMADEIRWRASHDSLTGLYNRQEFENELHLSILSAKEIGLTHCLLYMDLAQFKVVNDTCGHIAGDELLRQLSEQFKNLCRESDSLARLGGDEFGLLMRNCPLPQAMSRAKSFLELLEDYRFSWDNNAFTLGMSIGLVQIDHSLNNIAEVLSLADMACYAAKDDGRNRIHIYQSNDDELIKRQGEVRWVSKIKDALENNYFCLYAQTISPIQTSANEQNDFIKHFEILIRLKDKEGKIISPIAFLPAAECYNLMPQVDRWVVKTAINYLSDNKIDDCILSLNLSGQTLGDDTFLDFIIDLLNSSHVSNGLICFEITETAAISNFNKALKFISELKKMGCSFSLDDFGSGLSSFSYLKNFPVDYLKIDGCFVKNIVDDRIDEAMVTAINTIGHEMNIKTIAEFVENDDILKKLASIKVDYAQGYGIAKPIPIEEAVICRH